MIRAEVVPPSGPFHGDVDIDASFDHESRVMEVCDVVLKETDCVFRFSGFGEHEWTVDVLDLSTFVEQLPDAVAALRQRRVALVDFYEQGTERAVWFLPEGDMVSVLCVPHGDGRPTARMRERQPYADALAMLTGAYGDFRKALYVASPTTARMFPERL